MAYAQYQAQLVPTALQGPNGQSFSRASGIVKDWLTWRAKTAVRARFPSHAPTDGLAALGDERGIPRFSSDTDAVYAERLRTAWDWWALSGTPTGLLLALVAAGFVNPEIRIQNALRFYVSSGVVHFEARPGEWLFDISPGSAFWSRFLVWIGGYVEYQATSVTVISQGDAYVAPDLVGLSPWGPITANVQIDAADPTKYRCSVDGGTTYSPFHSRSSSTGGTDPFDVGTWAATGLTIHWNDTGSGYDAGDEWQYAVTAVSVVPANGSADALLVQSIIRAQKPAFATCADIIVFGLGRTWGTYPPGSTWGSQGRATWGSDLATVTHWSP